MMISFESPTEKVYVLENGECTDLKEAVDILRGDEIKVCIDLRQGEHNATCWGCDLSEEYVKINAGYN